MVGAPQVGAYLVNYFVATFYLTYCPVRLPAVGLQLPPQYTATRSSAIVEGPRDASCQLKSCQLPRNSAETTCTTSSEQIEVMKLEG